MIECTSKEKDFETLFTNGRHTAISDVPPEKGGGDAGFRPHELLEASLACCINVFIRKYAAGHHIPLAGVEVEVSLNRQVPGETVFEYGVELTGNITAAQRQELLPAVESCPVYQILSGKISCAPLPL